MIIKTITIHNFRSYYKFNQFDFSEGLTLIIGDNGDGKTTFFEALQWLFNTTTDNVSISHASEMRKAEMEIGETDEVCVSIEFEHGGNRLVEKSFQFEKTGPDTFRTKNFEFKGYSGVGPERIQVSGKNLIDVCFDAFMQKFSMFKGESTLNVFDNPETLKELVNKLSDIRKFESFVKMTEDFEDKSEKVYLKECKNDEKVSRMAQKFEYDIADVSRKINDKRQEFRNEEKTANLFQGKLEELEKSKETSEKYNDIKERLKTQGEKATRLRGMISSVNYNWSLLDKYWILCAFPDVLQEFRSKSAAYSKEKRKQQDAFIEQKAINKGKLEVLNQMQNFANGVAKLPWYLPDEDTMQEMIDDEICKVCGRPAPKGSDAYNFMIDKLNEYRKNLDAQVKCEEAKKAEDEKQLFTNSYVEEIHNMSIGLSGSTAQSISQIASDINDRLDLVRHLREELKDIELKIQNINDEKARLLIQADGISESMLEKDFKDLKGYFDRKGRAEQRMAELGGEIKALEARKAQLEKDFEEIKPTSDSVDVLKKVHITLDRIAKAFKGAKEENLRRFLSMLEEKANYYLKQLNVEDFHGVVTLNKMANESTRIRLYSSNGVEITNPGGAQRTTMYMSILFAISDLTTLKKEENYPLIFDAPTSSFGSSKEDVFYNVIDKIDKQCIIVTKDLLEDGKLNEDKINKLSCSVYRIQKEKTFNPTDLSTIKTVITRVK